MTVEDRDLMWGLVGKHGVTLRLDAAAAAAPTAAGPERLSQPVRELTVPLTMPWRGTGLYWNFDNSHNSQIQSRRRPAVKPQAKRRQSRCKVETQIGATFPLSSYFLLCQGELKCLRNIQHRRDSVKTGMIWDVLFFIQQLWPTVG